MNFFVGENYFIFLWKSLSNKQLNSFKQDMNPGLGLTRAGQLDTGARKF